MEEEIWKDIEGWEGYQVSNLGRVRSLDREIIDKLGRKLIFNSTILIQEVSNKGYNVVNLSKNGHIKKLLVHRLVGTAFIPNNCNLPCIDHIDGNRQNNLSNNLRWVTYKVNSNNPITKKRMSNNSIRKGIFNGIGSKPIEALNDEGKVMYAFPSMMEAHRNGFDFRLVSACCRGKLKTYKGYRWSYTPLQPLH